MCSFLGGKLTDISGNKLYYGAKAQIPNSGGVLATAHWVKHEVGFILCITCLVLFSAFGVEVVWIPNLYLNFAKLGSQNQNPSEFHIECLCIKFTGIRGLHSRRNKNASTQANRVCIVLEKSIMC